MAVWWQGQGRVAAKVTLPFYTQRQAATQSPQLFKVSRATPHSRSHDDVRPYRGEAIGELH